MVAVEKNEWVKFEVDHESVGEHDDAGPDEEWNCYRGDMRKIKDDAETEDGTHEVPFWAMESFYEITGGCDKDGWFQYKFRRVIKGGKSVAEFREA